MGCLIVPLINSTTLLAYVNVYRVAWFMGRYGGGKTSLAFRIAGELCEKYGYRYVISNVKSVWNTDPADVVLRQNKWVDAVIVLDEGGLFLENSFDAKKFLAFLRKLNIVLLVPSVLPPSPKMRFLSIQRMLNLNLLGLPIWTYMFNLTYGNIKENGSFFWRNPHEIYGIYDTNGFPEDDVGLAEYVQKWIAQAKRTEGYKETAKRKATFTSGESVLALSGSGNENQSGKSPDWSISFVEELRRVAASVDDSAAENANSISLLAATKRGRKRGR